MPHDPTWIALDDNGLPIYGVIGGRLGWELTKTPGPDAKPGPDTAAGTNARSGIGAQSLAATLSWSEAEPRLFGLFPFRHDLLYEARLAEGRLEIEVTVHACGEDAVPLAFGFHPYLAPGGPREQWQIELPAMRHLELDRRQIPLGIEDPASGPQRFELGEREFDDGFDVGASPARPRSRALCRRRRRAAARARVPARLPLRAGLRSAVRALHLLRADDRSRQRVAQRRRPEAARAG